jgi:uncharacterized membrane protein YuzA (DUF378 family)
MFLNESDLDETAHYYIWLHIVTISLVLIGALNWGSIGLFSYNFVSKIFKSYSDYIYILVYLATVHLVYNRYSYFSFLGWTSVPDYLLKPYVSPTRKTIELIKEIAEFIKK